MSRINDREGGFLSRREAIRLGVAASAFGLVGLDGSRSEAATNNTAETIVPATGPGHVVRVHKPGMRGRNFPHASAANEMVQKAVTTLTGEADPVKAWSRFISADDRVGIKINVLGGRFSSTTVEVVNPIVEGVRSVGVPDENIMIFDQFGGNMRAARYQWQDKPGKLRVINHEVLGYEDDYTRTEGGGKGKLAKTLTWSTAIINVPVLKDHDLAGITCAMKNMVFGCVERPPMMHREIHTALPHFYALEQIRGRVRLIICDGSFCLFDGGPKHNAKAHVSHDSVYATTDPVAMDAVCFEIVEKYRASNKMRTLAAVRRPVAYLSLAEKIGLGVADRNRIRLETVELPPVEA